MKPSEALKKHRNEVLEIIAAYSVTNPRVFGSVARGMDTEESDLDILVDKSERTTYFELFDLTHRIEMVLGANVEMFLFSELKPHVRDRVMREAVAL